VRVADYRKRRRAFDAELAKMAANLRTDLHQWEAGLVTADERLDAHRATLETVPEGNDFALRDYMATEYRLEGDRDYASRRAAGLRDQIRQIGEIERLVYRYLNF